MEEVLEIDDSFGPKYAGKYVFKPITWATYTAILLRSMTRDRLTGAVLTQDDAKVNNGVVLASLKTQPSSNPVTMESLTSEDFEQGVPPMLGAKLLRSANKVSMLSLQETNQLTLSVIRNKPTIEAVEAYLCTELKCKPSELSKESAKKIQELIVFLNAQNQRKEAEIKSVKATQE